MLANKITANTLTQQALTVLKLNGWEVWRNNNLAVKGRAFIGRVGVPDIIGFNKKDARMIGVEIKVGADKMSNEQNEFLDQLNKAGGVGIECRCIEDIINHSIINYN